MGLTMPKSKTRRRIQPRNRYSKSPWKSWKRTYKASTQCAVWPRTGQLSLITFFLQFLGSVARFLTTLQLLGKDMLSLISHSVGAVLNLVVASWRTVMGCREVRADERTRPKGWNCHFVFGTQEQVQVLMLNSKISP